MHFYFNTNFANNQQNIRPVGIVQRAVFNTKQPVSIDAALVLITDHERLPEEGQFAIDNAENVSTEGNFTASY